MINIRPGVRNILVATFFFALMQIAVKLLGRLPTAEIVFFRALIALVICWVMLRRRGISPAGNHKLYLILRGVCGATALFLFFYTLQRMPLATAVTLQYLSPIFTILFAIFIMRESTSARQWLAFIIAVVGVALVKGFDPRVSLLDLGLGVAAAVFSGLAYNFVRKLKDHDDPLVVVFYFPLVTVPLVLPFMIVTWVWPEPWEWMVLALVGVCTQVAQIAMTHAYQLEKASDITIYNYLGVLYAIVFGLIFFGEWLEPLSALGILVVIAGVYLGTKGVKSGRRAAGTGGEAPIPD